MTPRVQILLSTYNGERFLGELLDSLLSQTYPDLSVRIRDDGSSDGTPGILEKYSRKFRKIRVERGENLGVIGSYLALLRDAEEGCDLFAFCDQDDVWLPDKVRDAVERLSVEDDDRPLLYCSRVRFVGADRRHLGYTRIPDRIGFGNALVENIIIGCTMVINRRTRELLLAADPGAMIMHDWWAYLLATAFGKVVYDERANILYRQHGGNVIGGTPGFVRNLFHRAREFRKGNFRVSDQAREFLRRYGTRLGPGELHTVTRFVESKSGSAARLAYLGGMTVWRQAPLDNLLLKALISLNLY